MHHLTFDFYRHLLLFFSPARMKEKTGTKKENSKGAKGTKDCHYTECISREDLIFEVVSGWILIGITPLARQ